MDWLPAVLSTGCNLTPRGGGFPGHIHDFDEICLVANEPSIIRHGGIERRAEANTVFLFRAGEHHGYRNEPQDEPHLWLVHYRPCPNLLQVSPRLADPDPERRVWRLDRLQLAGYRGIFIRLQGELARGDQGDAPAAAAAWLRLLLIMAARWDSETVTTMHDLPHDDPELMTLYEIIREHVDHPADLPSALRRRVVNYDALRHRFKRTFGVTPRDLLGQLRMERARNLLLESDLRLADIAERLGYARAQEFSRAFHAAVGCTPGEFRENPFR